VWSESAPTNYPPQHTHTTHTQRAHAHTHTRTHTHTHTHTHIHAQGAAKSLQEGSEETVVVSCQVLVELIEVPAPLLQPHLPAVLSFCMQVAVQGGLELETREQALQVLHWVAR
jgi:hypothetical protein